MASSKRAPVSRLEIEQAIYQHISDATTYLEAELSPDRIQATKYYRGDKFGNEETGRSQFVCTDVRDTVLAMLPSLVRLFLPTSGHVIQYQARPKTPQEIPLKVAAADQATEMVNGVVLDQDNNGYLELHGAFKDALVRKLGTIKYWWEDASNYKDYTAKGCDVLQVELLRSDPNIEITKETKQESSGVPYWDVEYRQWRYEGYARMVCCPPEEILISRDARTREDATFIGHRTEKTKSELLAMGVPEEEIDQFGGPSTEVLQSLEEVARRGSISHIDKAAIPSEVKSLWIEGYCHLDLDGDGISELCRVRTIGPGFHIVGDPEPVDERPFAFFCPDPEPHVLIGQSVGDRVQDLQLMKSSIFRALADGLSMSIFPRRYFMEGVVDRQAMESTAISQDVAVRDGIQPSQAVMVENFEWKGNDGLLFVQALDAIKQQRTGPLPATLDPDSLQSTPEIGVKATVQAASEQVELIARNFCLGMKQLGKGLLKLLVENQPRARIVRLRGQYVEVDPRAWDADMDVSVNVAIGTTEKVNVLAALAEKQEQVLQTLGPVNPLVTLGQYRQTLATILQLQGIPDVGKYLSEVDDQKIAQMAAQQPQQPNPDLILAQAETIKAQGQLAKNQADFALEQAKQLQTGQESMTTSQLRAAELALRREEMHLTDERERDKAEADVAVKIAIAKAQFGSTYDIAQLEADIEREKMEHDAQQSALETLTKQPAGAT